jgi:pyruvate dehydrogenase E2 component (dihydrolipoamide acetyltransferase)
MATNVIMPALEMAQETGKVIRWLVAPGASVTKGQPIVEIETDKITVEIEAPAAGVLASVTANEGDVVPVGRTIAVIAGVGEAPGAAPSAPAPPATSAVTSASSTVKASPLARKIAEQHGVDIAQIKTASGRVEKADVLAYVETRGATAPTNGGAARLPPASPKARRLAAERGVALTSVRGSGPGGAVLAGDVPAAAARAGVAPAVGTVWRVMAERMTQSWTTAPHFYLVREVNASRLKTWREAVVKRTGAPVTYTDLFTPRDRYGSTK